MSRKKKGIALSALATALSMALIAGPLQAFGDPASIARGAAYGVQLNSLVDLGPAPIVQAAIPPGARDHQEDVLVEVPAQPLATSFTARVEGDASAASDLAATLQSVMSAASSNLPTRWNSRGYAIVEDLRALSDALTAEVIESESTVSCVNGQPQFATGSQIVNLSLNGQAIPVLNPEPNQVLFDQLGIRIVMWETNWNPATKGTTDGSDTVFANALHVTDSNTDTDLIVSHSEATASCDDANDDDGVQAERDTTSSHVSPAPPAEAVAGNPSFTG